MITVTVPQLVLGLIACAAVSATLTALALYKWRKAIAREVGEIRAWVKNAEDVTAWTRQIPDEASTVTRRKLADGWGRMLTASGDLVRIGLERMPFAAETGRHRSAVTR